MKRKWIIAILTTAIIGIVSPAVAVAADAVTLTAQAEQLMQENDFDGAAAILSSVTSDYPTAEKTWHARVRLAECYFHQAKYDQCILEARKITNLYPASAPQVQAAWAQFYIGIACAEKNDIEAAKWELSRVEQVTGQNPDRGAWISARNELALLYHSTNNRRMAARIASEVIADSAVSGNDRAWAEVILGTALVGDHKTEEGLAILRKAKRDYPQFQEPMRTAERKIFDVTLGRHDYDGILTECRALLADPNVSETRAKQAGSFLLLTLQYKKDYDKVLSETQILMDRFTYSVDEQRSLLHNRARMLAWTKQYDKAVEGFKALLATNPPGQDFCAHIEWDLALCYQMTGQRSLANETFTRIAKLYPASHLAGRAADKLQAVQ